MRLKRLIGLIILALGMVEGAVVVGLATLLGVIVLIWRVWVVEEAVHERIDGIDSSLGGVVGMMIEKIDAIGNKVPDINLQHFDSNPIGQLFDFLRGNAPQNHPSNPNMPTDHNQKAPEGANSGYQPTTDSTGQFVEVKAEPNGTQKE